MSRYGIIRAKTADSCFKGTAKRSQQQLELEIENMGGHLNAYTSVGLFFQPIPSQWAHPGGKKKFEAAKTFFSVRTPSTSPRLSTPTFPRPSIFCPISCKTPSSSRLPSSASATSFSESPRRLRSRLRRLSLTTCTPLLSSTSLSAAPFSAPARTSVTLPAPNSPTTSRTTTLPTA